MDGIVFQPGMVYIPAGGPPSGSYYAAVIADGPIAYWRLGESSGTTAVDDVAAFDGTYVGSPTLGVTGAVSGDTAVDFDGTNDRVDIPDFGISGGAARSVEVFYKSDSTGSLQCVFFSGDHVEDITTYYKMFVIYANVIATGDVYFNSNGHDFYTAAGVAPVNSWNHVVVTYAGGTLSATTLKIYVNGVAQTLTEVAAVPGAANTTADTGAIGYSVANAGRYFNGVIDEVAVYDYVLTPTQVADHYAAVS